MKTIKLTSACNIVTGKLDSNAAVENGKYPYFTCAPEPLKIDTYAFDDNAILLAGNNASGNFHCQRYNGRFNAYQRTYVITAKQGYDIDFIYYSLLMNLQLFRKIAQGSQTKFLTMEILDGFELDDLSYEKQIELAKAMKEIDEKIVNNNAICSNLEAMAKLLYDYWFVQFDFSDENGKPYKSSDGKMVWNDELKREIPAGWEVKPLSAFIFESKNGDWGNDKPKKKDDIEVTCFRGADFASITDDYQVTAPIRYISANNADRLLSDGDLVTEISGGSPTQATGRVGYINQKFLDRNGGKMDCSNFCKAFTPMKRFYQYWLYQTWKAFYDAGVMFNYESKTTGIKNLMFDEFITWVRVPAPSDELLKKYQEVCSQYYDKIQEEFIESTQLASLRDFLLPMLMNGQVKIKNDEA